MKDYSFAEIGAAVDELQTRLGCRPPPHLLEEFQFGLHPNLLAYEKGRPIKHEHTALSRCLVGAESAARQPAHHYDIFGACRRVKLVQLLNHALKVHDRAKTKGVEERLKKLKAEMQSDAFDAIVFELLVGARYVERPGVAGLEYVPETSLKKTPDMTMRQHGRPASCECKKLDRSKDFAVKTRASANAALAPTLAEFRRRRVSVTGDLVFHEDPSTTSPARLRSAFLAALDSSSPIIEPGFVVAARELPAYVSDSLQLYPSPAFAWERYGYRVRGEWMGIVHQLVGSRQSPVDPPHGLKPGPPSWIHCAAWDCGIKWRIGEKELFAKYRRFAFNTLKGSFAQLTGGANSVVHAWLESDYFLGGRKDVLEDFLANVSSDPTFNIGWIVVNETQLDISPKGFFDMIEHGHYMRGPTAVSRNPEVTTVFTDGGARTAVFGRGVNLPDIDGP